MKINGLTFFLLFFILCACSQKEKVRLYVLDGGSIEAKDAAVLGLDSGKLLLANNVFLIKHPKGFMLWDTGLPEDLIDSINGAENPIAIERVKKRLTTQLNEIGVNPKDIIYLALSHMHADHTGNANLFIKANLLIQEKEFNLAFSDSATKYYFNPKSYNKLNNFIKIKQSLYDVFGDGKVVIYQTPGHTIGHQSLMLHLENEGYVFITGDLFHHSKNRAFGRFPIFNHDQNRTKETVEIIEKEIKAKKAKVIIQHDPNLDKELKKSPAYYD